MLYYVHTTSEVLGKIPAFSIPNRLDSGTVPTCQRIIFESQEKNVLGRGVKGMAPVTPSTCLWARAMNFSLNRGLEQGTGVCTVHQSWSWRGPAHYCLCSDPTR